MLKKVLAVVFALLVVTACKSKPADNASAGAGGDVNNAGAVVPGSQEDLRANVGDRVFFVLDSSAIDSESQATLARQVEWLKRYADKKVTVEGHCDERGTREYNIALGERRANAAKKFLVRSGIDAARISTISYGKERPEAVGSDENAWKQNRRAVTVVVQ